MKQLCMKQLWEGEREGVRACMCVCVRVCEMHALCNSMKFSAHVTARDRHLYVSVSVRRRIGTAMSVRVSRDFHPSNATVHVGSAAKVSNEVASDGGVASIGTFAHYRSWHGTVAYFRFRKRTSRSIVWSCSRNHGSRLWNSCVSTAWNNDRDGSSNYSQ